MAFGSKVNQVVFWTNCLYLLLKKVFKKTLIKQLTFQHSLNLSFPCMASRVCTGEDSLLLSLITVPFFRIHLVPLKYNSWLADFYYFSLLLEKLPVFSKHDSYQLFWFLSEVRNDWILARLMVSQIYFYQTKTPTRCQQPSCCVLETVLGK